MTTALKFFLITALATALMACSGSKLNGGVDDQESPAQLYTKMGLAYLQKGNIELALSRLRKALELEPDSADAHHYIAAVFRQLDRNIKADQHYRRAIKLAPKDLALKNNYGTFLCDQNRFAEAEGYFLDVADSPTYPTPYLVYENAALCALRNRDARKAEDYFRKALELNPNLPRSLYHMAELQFEGQHWLKTRAYLQRYSAIAPHSSRSLWLGIRVERELGDEESVSEYAAILEERFPQARETQLLRQSKE